MNAHGAGEGDGVGGDALGVAFSLGVLQVEGVAQGLKGDVVGVLQILHGLAEHFGSGADDLLEVLLVVVAVLKGLSVVESALDGVDRCSRSKGLSR